MTRASVSVRGERVASIDRGLLLLVASGRDDGDDEIEKLAAKIFGLRVFENFEGKTERSAEDVGGEFLVVPQFTLYGDVRKGRRPSWDAAAPPEVAAERVEAFAAALEAQGGSVSRGSFREHMEVDLVNDGPLTLIIDGAGLAPS